MGADQVGSYDILAPFYDDGIGVLFGKEIFDAQLFFLSDIQDFSSILILGGGSGWLLPELFKKVPNAKVCYIDASKNMIGIARTKTEHPVDFIRGTEFDIPNQKFDYVITNFYVDGFDYEKLKEKIKFISGYIQPSGKWFVTDFVETGKTKHRLQLFLIHLFFRILIGHPNKNLVDWQKAFDEIGLATVKYEYFKNGFIKTIIYT